MADNNQYWNELISKGLSSLQEKNNNVAAAVLKKATFDVEHRYHDSWSWGTDYWELVLYLKYGDYAALGDRKEQAERDIMSALVSFQKGSRDLLSTVSIRPAAEEYVEWSSVLPFRKAAEDAETFINEGSYDNAFDRIHTAFSDYVKYVLTEQGVHFETDDSLSALFAELCEYYSSSIRPSEAEDRTGTILTGIQGITDAINELKNGAEAHPDGQPVEKREAQLAIGMLSSVVDYIEDIRQETEGEQSEL